MVPFDGIWTISCHPWFMFNQQAPSQTINFSNQVPKSTGIFHYFHISCLNEEYIDFFHRCINSRYLHNAMWYLCIEKPKPNQSNMKFAIK